MKLREILWGRPFFFLVIIEHCCIFSNTVADPGEANPLISGSNWGLKSQKISLGGFPLISGSGSATVTFHKLLFIIPGQTAQAQFSIQ